MTFLEVRLLKKNLIDGKMFAIVSKIYKKNTRLSLRCRETEIDVFYFAQF